MSGQSGTQSFLPGTAICREALDLKHRQAQNDTINEKVTEDKDHPYHLIEGKFPALCMHTSASDPGIDLIFRRVSTNEASIRISTFFRQLKADIGWHEDCVLESTRIEFGRVLKPLVVALIADCMRTPGACSQTVRESLVKIVVLKAQEVLDDAVIKQEYEVQQRFFAFKNAVQEAGRMISESLSEVDQLPDEMGPVIIDLTAVTSPDESEIDEENAAEEFVNKLLRKSGITPCRPLVEEQTIDPWRPDRVDEAIASIEDELRAALQDEPFGSAAMEAQELLKKIKEQATGLKESCRRLCNCKIVRTNARDTVCLTAKIMAQKHLWKIEGEAIEKYDSRVLGASDTDGNHKQQGTIDPRKLIP